VVGILVNSENDQIDVTQRLQKRLLEVIIEELQGNLSYNQLTVRKLETEVKRAENL